MVDYGNCCFGVVVVAVVVWKREGGGGQFDMWVKRERGREKVRVKNNNKKMNNIDCDLKNKNWDVV